MTRLNGFQTKKMDVVKENSFFCKEVRCEIKPVQTKKKEGVGEKQVKTKN